MSKLDMQRMKTTNREMKDIYQEMAELHHAIYEALNKENIYERAKRVTEKLNALNIQE